MHLARPLEALGLIRRVSPHCPTVLLATHFERAVLRFLPEQPLANLLLYPRHTRSLGNGLGSSVVLRRPVIHQLRLGIGNCLKGSLSQM